MIEQPSDQTIAAQAKQQEQPVIQIDWRSYYRNFERFHGENPVLFQGRLLFHDGWSYSATDYAGPEWPPPLHPDALKKLRTMYWLKRRSIVQAELNKLKTLVKGLQTLQNTKSQPLPYLVPKTDDTGKRVGMETVEFNDSKFAGRVQWLEDDIVECNKYLEELSYAVRVKRADQDETETIPK